LKKTKRERKLSTFEFSMYIITQIAIFAWVASFFSWIWDINGRFLILLTGALLQEGVKPFFLLT